MASHSGVSIGLCGAGPLVQELDGDVGRQRAEGVGEHAVHVAVVWPGRVRMSTSSTTSSGMTLVLVPPWTTSGENVVWVQAWANLAVRASAIDSHAVPRACRVDQGGPGLGIEVERGGVGRATRR